MPISKLLWGAGFENELRIGFPLFDLVTDREEREGSEHIQAPSGVEDAWITGRDYVIDAEVRWIPDGPGTAPVQTQLSGAVSWQAFLDYARDANALRFIPDDTAPDFYIDNVYLVEPRKGFGNPSADIKRNVRIKLRNATMDFHQALRGVMLQIQAGMSLTDPTVVTFTRADATTCATRIKRDGTIETVAANVLRTEWVDLDGDGIRETPGLLLEGSRTNIALRSEEFDNATWTKSQTTVTANATTAPDGTATADHVLEVASAANHYIYQTSMTITSGEAVVGAVEIKNGGRFRGRLYIGDISGTNLVAADFNLTAGTVSAPTVGGAGVAAYAKITALGNGWYRVEVAGKINGGVTSGHLQVNLYDDGGAINYTGDAAKGLYLWGAQFERAVFSSSYIKTVASAVTRAADSLSVPFNWGPMDLTVLARVARPVWADAVGDIVTNPGIADIGSTTPPQLRLYGTGNSRFYHADIITPGADGDAFLAIPAGVQQTLCAQFKNLTTAGQSRLDVGAGFGAFGTTAAAFSAFGTQTLRIGCVSSGADPLYGVLLDLKIASKLRTLGEMLAL